MVRHGLAGGPPLPVALPSGPGLPDPFPHPGEAALVSARDKSGGGRAHSHRTPRPVRGRCPAGGYPFPEARKETVFLHPEHRGGVFRRSPGKGQTGRRQRRGRRGKAAGRRAVLPGLLRDRLFAARENDFPGRPPGRDAGCRREPPEPGAVRRGPISACGDRGRLGSGIRGSCWRCWGFFWAAWHSTSPPASIPSSRSRFPISAARAGRSRGVRRFTACFTCPGWQ